MNIRVAIPVVRVRIAIMPWAALRAAAKPRGRLVRICGLWFWR